MEQSSDTTNLLRPNQVQEAKEELRRLSDTLNAAPHVRGKISDPREMARRKKRLSDDIDRLEPRAYPITEKDVAVREFRELGAKIKQGMPSSEEMRRNAPGCVEKHMAWEKRAKPLINRWKHVGLRLEKGGDVPPEMNVPGASINVEVLRELKTNYDVSMDGAQIPKTRDIHIGADPVGTVLFTAAEETLLAEVSPQMAGSLAVLDNETRAKIKALLADAAAPAADGAAAPADKPEMADLNFQAMQALAKKNGMNTYAKSKAMIASWLRANHIIR